MSEQLMEDFKRMFELPEAMAPFVGLVASQEEMQLVVALAGEERSEAEIASVMGWTAEEGAARLREAASRNIVRTVGATPPYKYAAWNFYNRMGPLARYERWNDVPAEVRQEVINWEFAEWVKVWAPTLHEMEANPKAYQRMPQSDFLLLSEALEMVDAADFWAAGVCTCRKTIQACEQPENSCIHLGEVGRAWFARGHGQELTREECRDLVIRLHKRGLMQTGDYHWREKGANIGFCNCCGCDCFPLRSALTFGLRTRYPRMHWIANKDASKCLDCGACVKRCNYQAHSLDGMTVLVKGQERKHVVFDQDKCWGCGLCATTCQQDAITMVPVDASLADGIFASDTARSYFQNPIA